MISKRQCLPPQARPYQPVMFVDPLMHLHDLPAQPLLIVAHQLLKRHRILRQGELLRGTGGAGSST